jgi:hypothetical protein
MVPTWLPSASQNRSKPANCEACFHNTSLRLRAAMLKLFPRCSQITLKCFFATNLRRIENVNRFRPLEGSMSPSFNEEKMLFDGGKNVEKMLHSFDGFVQILSLNVCTQGSSVRGGRFRRSNSATHHGCESQSSKSGRRSPEGIDLRELVSGCSK